MQRHGGIHNWLAQDLEVSEQVLIFVVGLVVGLVPPLQIAGGSPLKWAAHGFATLLVDLRNHQPSL